MSLNLYMDVHVRAAITNGLRLRGVNVATAQEDGARRFDDPALLDRATELHRVLFTNDRDLPAEAARRQAMGESFSGVIYVHQMRLTIGETIRDLEFLATNIELEELRNSVVFLPL